MFEQLSATFRTEVTSSVLVELALAWAVELPAAPVLSDGFPVAPALAPALLSGEFEADADADVPGVPITSTSLLAFSLI